MKIEAIIWILFLLDAAFANLVTWLAPKWYKKKFNKGFMKKHLPLTKGWALIYLALVLWLGHALLRLGIINL
jgi:hypothetical protein